MDEWMNQIKSKSKIMSTTLYSFLSANKMVLDNTIARFTRTRGADAFLIPIPLSCAGS
jgi:hypothetical protein